MVWMIQLTFNDLNEASQERLLENSKKYVEAKFGTSIRHYAKTQFQNYDELLQEEAIRNLYNYKYSFQV